MTIEFVAPNMFQLTGHNLHVSYSSTSFAGQPQLAYQDAHQQGTFSGQDITTTQTELGTLVTVFLRRTVDAGSTTFTLIVPRCNLPQGSRSMPVHTQGIVSVHRFSVIPAFNSGQLDNSTVHALSGTASFVAA